MSKKTKKILVIIGLSLLALIIAIILALNFFLNEFLVKPTNIAKTEAKSRAAYLLHIQDKTTLKKVGEAGMAETIDNNNHCYTYVFQGTADYFAVKNTVDTLLIEAGYKLEKSTILDSENVYRINSKANDGWTTQIQVLNNTALLAVAEDVIDNPVSTKVQAGQVLVSGQVCNM